MPIRPSFSRRRIVRSERTTGRFYGRSPPMLGALSMGEPDPNARLRERRRQRRRRQIRIRRAVALGALLALGTGIALGARAVGGGHARAAPAEKHASRKGPAKPSRPAAPDELRGGHVTMALASLPGRLDRYLGGPGLDAIEPGVKDADRHVGPGTHYDAR